MTRPSAEKVREFLEYQPLTGKFILKKKTGFKGVVGREVGSLKPNGYVAIQFDGYRTFAHRLAWVWMTGAWPTEIDHKNGNRSDNRWDNLRECTRQQNNGNRHVQRKYKYHDLPRGVIRCRNRGGSISYHGRIIVNEKQIHLGSYSTPEEAHAAYSQAAKEHFGEFAREQ